jgi:ketosteroid isomerase-like protein
MSQENVDRFVEGVEAFNRRDLGGAFRFVDPGVRWEHWLGELQGTLVGIDAARAWHADLFENFASGEIHCTDIRDLGDRVLALGTVSAVGTESGVETEHPFTVLARFKNGLVTEFTDFGDRAKALEAAGLRE